MDQNYLKGVIRRHKKKESLEGEQVRIPSKYRGVFLSPFSTESVFKIILIACLLEKNKIMKITDSSSVDEANQNSL